MDKLNIAILGATGAVGREMLKTIAARVPEADGVRLFASARSAGERMSFRSGTLTVEEIRDDSFDGMDFVLGAVEAEVSRRMAERVRASGAVYIDNSSAFRLCPDVPLVVPEINGEDALGHRGIIANPNCSTVIAMMAAAPISRLSPLKSVIACTYQAVSGAGLGGLRELERQTADIAAGREPECGVFPAQIAMNVIPHIGETLDDLYTDEEMKMQNEGRRLLHLPELKVNCTCVRVPVMRSHSIALTVRTERPVGVEEAREAIRAFPGCVLAGDVCGREWPTPLDASGGDLVMVGRIRKDLCDGNGLSLWCCGDQIRKGAALNAVQILQYLAKNRQKG